jgi:hypothetical protein
MLPANLNDLTHAHIQNLIDSEVAESLTLEYKRELPSGNSEQKKEFLYDIAAMANAAGGDILYGIADRKGEDKQNTGIADRVAGMKLSNLQTETTRLSQWIRDGIAPRLTAVTMQMVSHQDGDVLVIRVPRSWSKPHMVIIDGTNKFFGRVATGKYPMSVDEIRRAFSEQGELSETIARWRSHRVELAQANKGPTPLASEVTLLFHVIPASAFTRQDLRETWKVSEQEVNYIYVPNRLTNYRYNADGFLCTARDGNEPGAYGYTQLFRSGIVEYADSHCFGPTGFSSDNRPSVIYGQELEKQMVQCYKDAIARVRKEGRTEALYVGFSLIGIANKTFFISLMSLSLLESATQQDTFISPEVLVDPNEPEDYPYTKTLLPLVDTMWQVAGRMETPFKPNGVWEPFRRY